MATKSERGAENLAMYERLRVVPKEAQRTIPAGRLKGFTDINAMWRIKALTSEFGPCGSGWYVTVEKQWIEQGANGEVCAFCNLSLYYKVGDEWSKPVHGTGGSAFVTKERNGPYTSDECFKMAYTDALSVCAKMIGVAADVYFEKDRTKYDSTEEQPATKEQPAAKKEESTVKKSDQVEACKQCGAAILPQKSAKDGTWKSSVEVAKSLGGLCVNCYREAKKHEVDV